VTALGANVTGKKWLLQLPDWVSCVCHFRVIEAKSSQLREHSRPGLRGGANKQEFNDADQACMDY